MSTEDFTALYDAHQEYIQGCASQYEKDPELRSDLCQDIWLEVFVALPSFKGTSNIKTWIWAIGERVCKDYIHDINREVEFVLDSTLAPPTELDEEIAAEGSWIEQAVPSNETAEDDTLLDELLFRVASLSEQEAAIFNLVYWDGQSYAAVAKRLGVTTDHVGVVCNRIRGKIEVKELYHKAFTYHSPGQPFSDWSWQPNGVGNTRMGATTIRKTNDSTTSSGEDSADQREAVDAR